MTSNDYNAIMEFLKLKKVADKLDIGCELSCFDAQQQLGITLKFFSENGEECCEIFFSQIHQAMNALGSWICPHCGIAHNCPTCQDAFEKMIG